MCRKRWARRCRSPSAWARPRNMPSSPASWSRHPISTPRRSASTAASAWRQGKLDELKLLDEIAVAAREAGEAILEVARRGFEVERKGDSSPVTEADRAAELIILAALARA